MHAMAERLAVGGEPGAEDAHGWKGFNADMRAQLRVGHTIDHTNVQRIGNRACVPGNRAPRWGEVLAMSTPGIKLGQEHGLGLGSRRW